jgi:glycosyltransferase involved in cell wall biosynthesis
MRVLLSAYACEPHKGSEPEVGWQWALQMARYHEVTVLTQTKNKPVIEQFSGSQSRPRFAYYALPHVLQRLRRFASGFKLYYILWQRSARRVVARLHQEERFELMHHITFAACRYPVAVCGHGVPCVWGPVGGAESVPWRLLPWGHPASLVQEVARNAHNLLQTTPFHSMRRRARASDLILASTREMQLVMTRLGFDAEVMPTIGLNFNEIPHQSHRCSSGPLKVLYVGNMITLKGIDLAFHALKQSGLDATFSLVGDGNYMAGLKKLAARLSLQSRVSFLGRLPRAQVLGMYAEHDLFVFPSLHDTGGYAVIEAMSNELPVVCLDCGGPAIAVQEGCGVKVPLGARSEVIDGLSSALRLYGGNRAKLVEHGRAARQAVLRSYDWDRKGEQMNERYLQATERRKARGG